MLLKCYGIRMLVRCCHFVVATHHRNISVGSSCCNTYLRMVCLCILHLMAACQERLKRIKKDHGSAELGKVDVNMVIGGMRGITVYPSISRRIERHMLLCVRRALTAGSQGLILWSARCVWWRIAMSELRPLGCAQGPSYWSPTHNCEAPCRSSQIEMIPESRWCQVA